MVDSYNGGLAHVFLRQSRYPGAVVGILPVEPFDGQYLLVFKSQDRRPRDGQAEQLHNLGTEPFCQTFKLPRLRARAMFYHLVLSDCLMACGATWVDFVPGAKP